jgi:AhpD family alkylhydroperoxidase
VERLGSGKRPAVSVTLPDTTLYLIEVRASQINGCSVCLDMHSRELKAVGEPDERVFMIGAWREAPYFSEAERAALALTEATTRLADRSDPIPDEVRELPNQALPMSGNARAEPVLRYADAGASTGFPSRERTSRM